ncbi:DHH family phosphoesterase [Patescibacteria group bacterium]|nr:DHH family phosphoesterase [Patescibacteria group bacterium]
MKIVSTKILESIKAANNIAVICHKHPDGDTLGAGTGLVEALIQIQKKYTLFCTTKSPDMFDWLPHINELQTDPEVLTETAHDLIIVLDSGSLSYAGVDKIIESLEYKYTLINIDHHNSNPEYGDINYVNQESSSTCEIMYELIRHWQISINKTMATSLLNGIMTDTGMLTNPATSDNTLKIASELMKHGANIYKIAQYNTRNKNKNLLNLWGIAMERLIYNDKVGSATTYITEEDFTRHKLDEGGLSGLSNFLSSLNDARFTLVLIEAPGGYIKGSLRTTRDDVNVGALAQKLGGGGHKKAAGFVIKGKLSYNDNEIKII